MAHSYPDCQFLLKKLSASLPPPFQGESKGSGGSKVYGGYSKWVHLFPFRTEKLSHLALMVLGHSPWESRSLPFFYEKPRRYRDGAFRVWPRLSRAGVVPASPEADVIFLCLATDDTDCTDLSMSSVAYKMVNPRVFRR